MHSRASLCADLHIITVYESKEVKKKLQLFQVNLHGAAGSDVDVCLFIHQTI